MKGIDCPFTDTGGMVQTAYPNIFGPVSSRRLGISLGVDLIPYKTCSYDCIYCELGRTTYKTVRREEYICWESVLEQLRDYLSTSDVTLDYITFSGSGEPTLNSGIGKIIRGVKELTSVPVAVLTNGSLLFLEQVRQDLWEADVVLPSLDAVTPFIFRHINRPHPSLHIKEIIDGLVAFREEFEGQIWLEILLCRAINDGRDELEQMVQVIERIGPDRVQLNTVVRPPTEDFAFSLNKRQLQTVKEMMGGKVEIISDFDKVATRAFQSDVEQEIISMLKRRPCTTIDLSKSLGIHPNEAVKYISRLAKQNRIRYMTYNRQDYYLAEG